MLARLRFRLYRWLLASATARGFETHEVWPIEVPADEHVDVEPLSTTLPRLVGPVDFPGGEHARSRMRRIRLQGVLLPIVSRIPAARTGPIADDLPGLLDQIYPRRYRKIWPQPPTMPPELEADDVLAALAVSGPFAMYLRRASKVEDLHSLGRESLVDETIEPDDYVIDMRVFDRYDAKPGLVAPGGIGWFRVDGDRLRTRGVLVAGRFHRAGEPSFDRARRLLLCALNTHLTTLLHNVTIHLSYVTPMVVASTNELPGNHPIRRLLHPACHTALIGNHELARFQVVGPDAFATRLFSHDHPTVERMIAEHVDRFRIAELDPSVAYDRTGLDGSPFELPYWNDALALWTITHDYVDRYVRHHYDDDLAVETDRHLASWAEALDDLLPGGLYDDDGHLTRGEPLRHATLARVCATFLHTSSATHDVVNNSVWDYSTLNHLVPTVVAESTEQQDVRLSFDFLTTLIGTWKPYNMLLDGFSQLALDDGAREIMDDYIAALRDRQERMEAEPRRPGGIYPASLNPSVSN